MDYDILTAELTNDPAGIGYAGMSDADAATAIMASTQPARQLVPLWLIKRRLIETGLWLEIRKAAVEHENPQAKCAAMLAVEYINDARFENLDLDLESTQQMIGSLVQAMIVTPSMAAELNAMGDTTTSRAAILGLPKVEPGHVGSARQMMGGND